MPCSVVTVLRSPAGGAGLASGAAAAGGCSTGVNSGVSASAGAGSSAAGGGVLCQLSGWFGSTVRICAAAGAAATKKAAAAARFTNDFSMAIPPHTLRAKLAPDKLSRP